MKLKAILLLLFLALAIAGCTKIKQNSTDTKNISGPQQKSISPADAKKRLDTEKNIILLDVRTIEEYEEKHIPNSTLIPLNTLEGEASKKLPDKSSTIFVYCRSGRRSASAYALLQKLGYSNVYDLGGIVDWTYEIESVKAK